MPLYNPAAGSSGPILPFVEVSISDGAVQDLTSSAPWIIAESSVGTDLAATITAAVGDRIKVIGRFMRNGAHFLDWNVLEAGVLATYLGSGTTTPLTEGDPALYPSGSFLYSTGDPVFTVTSAQRTAGQVTVALAHSGTSAGRVYCYSGYPFKLRLENMGAGA